MKKLCAVPKVWARLATKLSFVFVFLFLILLLNCTKNKTEERLSVAFVNNEPIALSTFVLHFNRAKNSLDLPSRANVRTIDKLKERTLNKLIFQKLIAQQAKTENIVVTDEELNRDIKMIKKGISPEQFNKNLIAQLLTMEEWRLLHQQKLLAEKVTRLALQIDRNVSERIIRTFYNKHKAEYVSEKKVRARQIYIKDESLAEDLLKRLKRKAKFEDLAKKYSLSPDALKGGDLGFFGHDEKIPEFNIAFSLQPGTLYRKVIKSSYGFHILKTVSVRKARQLKLSRVSETIRHKILEMREETHYKKWLEELLKKATITKNPILISTFDQIKGN